MRRSSFCSIAVAAATASILGLTAVPASAATTGVTTFAVTVSTVNAQDGYGEHISGVGLNGPWRGWHFAADMVRSTDCYTDCPIERFAWMLYDKTAASTEVWGTCTGADLCEGAGVAPLTGNATVPLTVTGGYPSSQGSGSITGSLPPGAPGAPAAGSLTLTLNLS